MNLPNQRDLLVHVGRFDLGPKMESEFVLPTQMQFDLVQGSKYSGLF